MEPDVDPAGSGPESRGGGAGPSNLTGPQIRYLEGNGDDTTPYKQGFRVCYF